MSLMGIDIGTTGCKAAVFSVEGERLAFAYREYPTLHPQPGWAELDSRLVWRCVKETIAQASGKSNDPVSALCVSAMGEAMTPVSAAGEILDNAILSSDIRGREYIAALERNWGQEKFYRINPNILAVNYSLPKLLWLREHQPELYGRACKWLLWCDLVSFLLGGSPVTSYSHANRTLLFDLEQETWSPPLLDWADIPREMLPETAPSGTITGYVAPSMARELGLPANTAIVLGGHDQGCNALGAGVVTGGKAVCGIGTIECLTPIFDRLPCLDDMLATRLSVEHHVLPGLYMSFVYNQSGSLLKWFRDVWAQADRELLAPGEDIYERLLSEMPAKPTGMLALPHFEPTGAPDYITDSAGVITGLHTDTTRGAILKAIMEGASFYFIESLDRLRRLGIDTSEFIATGGVAKSDALLQLKADIFGAPFVRLRNTECGVAGAAMLAGLATGGLKDTSDAVARFVARDRVFEPDENRHRRYREIHARYARLYPLVRAFTEN